MLLNLSAGINVPASPFTTAWIGIKYATEMIKTKMKLIVENRIQNRSGGGAFQPAIRVIIARSIVNGLANIKNSPSYRYEGLSGFQLGTASGDEAHRGKTARVTNAAAPVSRSN